MDDSTQRRLETSIIQNARLAYDMRDSVHDADFLTYLWAAVEKYNEALPRMVAGKASSDFEPGKGWRYSDGSYGARPEQ